MSKCFFVKLKYIYTELYNALYKMAQEQYCDDLLNNEEEFRLILSLLNDTDLAILQQTFLQKESDQHQELRRLRQHTDNYGTLYNAYTARVLVSEPNYYVEKEIVSRFINIK